MVKQLRDNEYYKQRIKKKRPDLYLQVMAGTMTVNKARQLSGLGATRTRLNELKHAWKQATAKEQAEFIRWAGLAPVPAPAPVSPTAGSRPAAHSVFDGRGVMATWAQKRVLEIMGRRSLSSGDLADELGLTRLDASVITAATNGTRIRRPAVIVAVEGWLAKNASV